MSCLLVPALLVMVSLALIPRRFRYWQLAAVVGWAVVWLDGQITGGWTDYLGSAVTMAAVVSLVLRHRQERQQSRT